MKYYYQILGLDEDASIEDIKRAYKLHAKKFHPDKHNGDSFFAKKFIEIQSAYEYLIQNFNNINKKPIDIVRFTSDKETYTKSDYINIDWEVINADDIEIIIKCCDKEISLKDLSSKGNYRFFAEHIGNIYIYMTARNGLVEESSRILITKSYEKDTWKSTICLGDLFNKKC